MSRGIESAATAGTPAALLVSVAAVNVKRGGYDGEHRVHDHARLRTMLPGIAPPDLLFLAECTYFDTDDERPLWSLVAELNQWRAQSGLPGSYMPFLSSVQGSKNVPGLLVATNNVEIECQYRPGPYTRRVHENFVVTRIHGVEVWLKSMHWNGSQGAAGLAAESVLAAGMAKEPVLIAGDFNCTSSVEGEGLVPDWENKVRKHLRAPWRLQQEGIRRGTTYVQNTEPMDDLLDAGFHDAGHTVSDYTTTTVDPLIASRKTRVLWSPPLASRIRLVNYEVLVVPTAQLPPGQDHYGVAATFEFSRPPAATELP
ncbi:endonuclease/exonuclease/phosphatase family protein [Amycolatopsis magusensis]|uniref:endonuclease/exonuclease/phosphatase family protein n=1 Tax=Amycolatopsis magusensis TaxID=882444 RepID=UPI0037887270